jgi:hypothetical protein
MDMVLHSADAKGLHLVFACDPSHVGPQPGLEIARDDLATLLGGEDAMLERGAISVCHYGPTSYRNSGETARPALRGGSFSPS